MDTLAAAPFIERTRHWIERVVVGLGLCPFARPIFATGQIHYRVSAATAPEVLVRDLAHELADLMALPAQQRETTLLIHPHVLGAFLDYNDFLDEADAVLVALDLDDDVQVASFHPHYRFADAEPDQIDNFTNRSPFPMLHLLRQASVEHARANHGDVEGIPSRNIATLQGLGADSQKRLREFRY